MANATNKKYRKVQQKVNAIAQSCVYLELHGGKLAVVDHDRFLSAKQWARIAKVMKKASDG